MVQKRGSLNQIVLNHVQLSSCNARGDFRPQSMRQSDHVAVFALWKRGVVQEERLLALVGEGRVYYDNIHHNFNSYLSFVAFYVCLLRDL